MTPETMIGRVARAICAADDSHDAALWREFIPEARAAIEAMRPLSPEIVKGLAQHFDNDITYGQSHSVRSLWGDAIEAILAEEQP